MSQFEIARLDEDGVIIAVETVQEADHRTDPVSRTVRLDAGHDMRKYLKSYRWDFYKNTFAPLSTEPLDVAERDTSELVEGLVETIEDLAEYVAAADAHEDNPAVPRKKFKISRRMKRVMKEYRRRSPRKAQPPAEEGE